MGRHSISIHTPARGVTEGDYNWQVIGVYISIHTPARGVTEKSQISIINRYHFNPHTREGCDFRPSIVI